MKRLFALASLGLTLLACNALPQPQQTRPLGVLEIEFNTVGVSSAKFERGFNAQGVTLREADLVLGTGATQVVSSTNAAHDYLVATFPVSHAASSVGLFRNLVFYALAKNGNIGGTAIKTITNFGGVSNTTEQTRLAKHLVPVQAVTTAGGNVVIDNSKADFQAFTAAEVTTAAAVANSLLGAGDTILNYGFAARCATLCATNSRFIFRNGNGTGNISFAIRVPKAALSTTYKFVMNFVVFDESRSRITRGNLQNESLTNAHTRGSLVTAIEMMQYGLAQEQPSTTLENFFVGDVQTSTLGASIQALGMKRMDGGFLHSCGLNSTGAAYCWGDASFGALGAGNATASLVPVPVSGGLSFSSIAAGEFYSCGITTAGAAYCWGDPTGGRLGNGTGSGTFNTPQVVSGGLTFSSISIGNNHTCALTTTGAAYCWGIGDFGKLGNNSLTNSNVPVPVLGGLTFSSITAGYNHSCGLTTTGAAYCWGYNEVGQLGNGSMSVTPVMSPVAVVAPTGGSVLTFSSIAAGQHHTCGITTAGAGYCWGRGDFGALGNGGSTDVSRPVAVVAPTGGSVLTFSSISTKFDHTCGIAASGAAYCWGRGSFGRLGNGGTTNSNVPVPVSGGLTFSSLAVGHFQACALTTTGTAHCWGRNDNGQLGNNTTNNATTPVGVISTNYNL